MAIARIHEFEAREGRAADLRELLLAVAGDIRTAAGCRLCQLLQDARFAGRFVVYEIWDDVGCHRAATRTVPPEMMQKAMVLLAGPPRSTYFRLEPDD